MATYRYTVNNMPQVWTVEVSGGKASSTAFGRTFEVEAEDADAALAAIKAEMEEIGWFFTDEFAKAS